MRYIKHNYRAGIKNVYRIGIPAYVGVGIMLFYLIYFQSPRPDRPIEYVGWGIVNFAIFWCILGAPFLILLIITIRVRKTYIGYYVFGEGTIAIITPNKELIRRIPFRQILVLSYPKLEGSMLADISTGYFDYLCENKSRVRYMSTYQIETKNAFRILLRYIKWLQINRGSSIAIIKSGVDADDWKIEDAIKKSLKKKDPSIWENFLEEWWKGREKGKEYWLNTPIEQILRDIHCPYTLEELENPSEDEIVEIDESKLKEVNC